MNTGWKRCKFIYLSTIVVASGDLDRIREEVVAFVAANWSGSYEPPWIEQTIRRNM
jgi:hypothetical protein